MTIGQVQIPGWFVTGLLILILCFLGIALFWFAEKILHVQLHGLVALVKSEWDDSKSRKRSVGAYNWKGFIALIIVGFVSMIFMTSQKVIGVVASFIGVEKAAELAKYTDFFTLVYALGLWMFCSLLCVTVDNMGRASRK